VVVPEILESVIWVIRKSLEVPEIQDRCFWSNIDSVPVPEVRESVIWLKQNFFGRSRQSGNCVL
jgi:hypothetical protein